MKHIIRISIGILISLIISIYPWFQISPSDDFIPYIPPTPLEETMLNEMTIEEKVGQLFIFGFDDTVLNEENKKFLEDTHVGGVLLLGKNISDELQIKALITDIQSTNSIPLFISIDQEGGTVSRISWDERLTIPQSDVGSREEAYTVAKERGEILKGYGINMNLAPVVEYVTETQSFMYQRAFRGSEDDVVLKGIGSVEGYAESGVIPVLKHYPGHGNTDIDSHDNLPTIDISNEQWDEYIYPFSNIIKNTQVDALMSGHIFFPNIDTNPSSISNEILTKRLKEDLGYEGLVISDDMEMDALDNIDVYTNIAKQALMAGNDMLIYSKYSNKFPTIQRDVYNYIVQEVGNGNMNIDDKVLKILRMKIKYEIIPQF